MKKATKVKVKRTLRQGRSVPPKIGRIIRARFSGLTPYQKFLKLNNFYLKIPFGGFHPTYAGTSLGIDMQIAVRKLRIDQKRMSACQKRVVWYYRNYLHKWRITEQEFFDRFNGDPGNVYFVDKILVPLYIELRKKGYSHRKLWA